MWVGTVRIKIFDDVVRDLTEGRFILQMNKNIISVGDVESKRLKITLENGVLKIMEGSMILMKGVRDRNLYYLKDSTVTVVDSNEDAAKLYHMRVNHAREKIYARTRR